MTGWFCFVLFIFCYNPFWNTPVTFSFNIRLMFANKFSSNWTLNVFRYFQCTFWNNILVETISVCNRILILKNVLLYNCGWSMIACRFTTNYIEIEMCTYGAFGMYCNNNYWNCVTISQVRVSLNVSTNSCKYLWISKNLPSL